MCVYVQRMCVHIFSVCVSIRMKRCVCVHVNAYRGVVCGCIQGFKSGFWLKCVDSLSKGLPYSPFLLWRHQSLLPML